MWMQIIADEGGQLSLATFMPAAMRGASKLTIFGDPNQLGPHVSLEKVHCIPIEWRID